MDDEYNWKDNDAVRRAKAIVMAGVLVLGCAILFVVCLAMMMK